MSRQARRERTGAFAAGLAVALALSSVSEAAAAADAPGRARVDTLQVAAPGIAANALRVRVFLPAGYRAHATSRWPVLYLNDGQDAEAVGLARTIDALARRHAIQPPIVVAIDAPTDRMAAYGFGDRALAKSLVAPTRYGDVGAHAQQYSEWLTHTLVPLVDARYRTLATPGGRAILGWSLGAANAMSVGWQYPELFARSGALSPSLWLASDRGNADSVQRTRIGQALVARTPRRDRLRLFLAVGTDEEIDDRDADGVNDALDDTRDLVNGWHAAAGDLKGLKQLGYRVNDDFVYRRDRRDRSDVVLYELKGGVHRQESWGRMLPVFLRWAYAPEGTRRASAP